MNTLPEITILYEDVNMVAIDKPVGIMVHGDGRSTEPTICDWFVAHYPDAVDVGEEHIATKDGSTIFRPGIVHRLDRDTSGVMLLAKTAEAHAHLKAQFQNHTIRKAYRAVVYGHMKEDSYMIDSPIGRAKTFGRWTAIPKAVRGTSREAETQISVLERFENKTEKYSYIEAKPKTGRTHQIRVHMQYANHPIVADLLYAGKRNNPKHNLGFESHALHALSISFTTLEGKAMTVTASLPEAFMYVVSQEAKG